MDFAGFEASEDSPKLLTCNLTRRRFRFALGIDPGVTFPDELPLASRRLLALRLGQSPRLSFSSPSLRPRFSLAHALATCFHGAVARQAFQPKVQSMPACIPVTRSAMLSMTPGP